MRGPPQLIPPALWAEGRQDDVILFLNSTRLGPKSLGELHAAFTAWCLTTGHRPTLTQYELITGKS